MNNKVSKIQVGMLLSLIMCGYFLGMSDIMLLQNSKSEVLISMLLGMIIGIIPIIMYLKINDTYPDLNIYEKCSKLFGKKLGIFINILIIISYSIIFAVAIRTIIIFSTSKYLENTPYLMVGSFIVICCFFATFYGLEPLLRIAQVAFIITVLITILVETTILGYVDIGNLFPIFISKHPVLNIIYGALFFASTSSFLSILLLSIKKNEIRNNQNFNKIIIIFYIYGVLSLIIVMFFIITCFGYQIGNIFRYPEYMILKKIGFSSSELHLENLLGFRWIFYSLSLTCTALYGIITGVKNYTKNSKINKIIIMIISFTSMFLSKVILGTVPNTLMIIKDYYIYIIAIPMFILLSLIFIRCLFKKKES